MADIYTVGPSGSGADYIVDGTNDQTEINTALQAASANPGSTVFLEGPFTYDIFSTNIKAGSNTEFTGDPDACLRLHDSVGWASMLPIIGQIGGSGTATSNLSIHGFEIDANRWNQPEDEGDAFHNCIGITGSASNFAKSISVYNMKIHDSLGDGFRMTHGETIKFYNNDIDVMGHEGSFFIDVVGGEVYSNDVVQKCNSAFRTDNCQNINIHGNVINKYTGIGANGNGAIQIGNEPASYGLTRLTQNINIYDNIINDGAGSGVLLMDAYGAAGTTPQTVHIYNNKMYRCGWMRNMNYNGGVSVWKWGNGLTVENNTIDGCYNGGVVVCGSISSGCTMQVSNNNILNTKNTLATDPSRMLAVSGYGLLNVVPSSLAVNAEENYMVGNVTGDYYQVTPISISTVLNGDYTSGSSLSRYIPPIRIIQEELTDYYIPGHPKLGYINGVPFYWQEKSADTSESVGQKKPPGRVGWSLSDFGLQGSELVLDCYAFSMDELYRVAAAFRDNSRGRSVLELGGPYIGKKVTGLTVDISSKLRLTEDLPEKDHPYSVSFLMDKPFLESTTKRVRGRHVYGSMKWSADDTYAGNLLKNASFEEWTQNNEMTWETEASIADNEWRNVKWSPELKQFCAVASTGTDNRIMIQNVGESWRLPTTLTNSNRNNNWRGLEWCPDWGIWVALSTNGTGDRCAISSSGDTWIAKTTPAEADANSWGCALWIPPNDTIPNGRLIAFAYAGTSYRVMYTDDMCESWTLVASAIEYNNWIDAEYCPELHRIVVVAYGGSATQRVMISDDYGATWTAQDSPAQKWTGVKRAGALGLFVACSEDGTQQIMTSPTGLSGSWTLQNTPVCGSVVVPGTGTDVATTTTQTPDGYVYSSGVPEYSTQYPGGPTLIIPALDNGHIWRIDRVFCKLKTALAGQEAYLKMTVETATIPETQVAEWISNISSYEDKSQDITIETAANEAVTIRCYMKSSSTSYKAYSTLIGYTVTEFDGAGGSSISYTYNQWRCLEWSPDERILVAVSQTGTGNRAMRSTDAANWILCSTPADNNLVSVCHSPDLNKFVAVGTSGIGNRIMSSDDYGGLQSPTSWTLETEGQTRCDTTAHDGIYSLEISGDGVMADRGRTTQYAMFDPGVSYVLSAWGGASGLTQGKLSVDIYSGNSIITQLLWDVDGEYTQKQENVRFDSAPTDAYIRVHGIDTLNDGAVLYCDDVLLCKKSDFELGTTGLDIATYGSMDVIPDVEIRAISSGSGTAETNGKTVTYVHPNINSEYSTAYSIEFSVTLPALSDGKKYRLDQVSCGLATADLAGLTAYMKIVAQSTSLGSVTVAEWTSVSRVPTYTPKILNTEIYSAAAESVTLIYYMKTSSSSGKAYANNISYVYTEIIPTVVSSAISIYNVADTLTVMDCCNELKPGCKITINADDTGNYQYSENFADTTYEYSVSDSAYITYYDDYKMLLFSAAGYITYSFDTKFPITGIPAIVLNVMSGAPQLYIAADNGSGAPGTWYALDGNESTEIIDAQAYRLLNSEGNLVLNNLTKFHLKIASDGVNMLRINSIFMYSDLVTIDAERPKIFKGRVNTFGAVVDSTASAVVTLKYNDADLLV